jgi:beta-lactamase regulating signal transducer with metallopeptidase domain/protein involved in polysaccharide export with SLBB domain
MNAQDVALALARTTLATTAACGLAWLLLTKLRIDSPRIHRLAWTLAILQGWLLFPWTLEIAAPPTPVSRGAIAERVHSPTAPISFTAVNQISLETRRSHLLLNSPLLAAVPVAAWLAGAVVLAVAGVYRYARVLRSLPLGSPPVDPTWRTEWRQQLDAASIPSRRRVDLRMTTDLGPLLCWTPWTYLVLAPKTLWAALTSPERQSILRHELAHLQRGDLWKSLAIRVLALPQWFNPLARLAVRRFDEAGEWACDDAAAGAAAGGPMAFANSLLRAAEFASAELPGSLAANGGMLSRRIHRLVTPRFKEESKMKRIAIPLLLIAVALVQVIRVERVSAESAEPSSKSVAEEASTIVDGAVVKTAAATKVAEERVKSFDALAKLPYVIEPPDILNIKVVNLAHKQPRGLKPFDVVRVQIKSWLSQRPMPNEKHSVEADGTINLGIPYGRVKVTGRPIEVVERMVSDRVRKTRSDLTAELSLVAANDASSVAGQHLVAGDGRVHLGELGSPYVAGKTVAQTKQILEKQLAKRFEDPEIRVEVIAYNSKVAYIIDEDPRKGDNVTRLPVPYPLSRDCNVGSVLEQYSLHANKLSEARITLRRPAPNGVGEELVFPIACDPSTGKITPETNHPLLPGDRIFVTAAGTAPTKPKRTRFSPSDAVMPPPRYYESRVDPAPTGKTAPAAPQADPPAAPADDSIAFKITVLEDPNGHLAEFESLRDGFMLDETGTARDALRVLEKNGLVTCVSSPQLVSRLGETCEMKMGCSAADKERQPREDVSIKVCARKVADTLLIDLRMERRVDGTNCEIDTGVKIESGQTVVLNASGPLAKSKGKLEKRQTYLVLTPTLVK